MKKELGIGALLVVLSIVVTCLNHRFLSPINLQNLSALVGMYGIFSIGLGIIIITGGIDLSVGSVFALQGVLLSMMLVQGHWPWPIATLAAIAFVVLLGVFHGFVITVIKMQPFIVTLCGLLFYRGMARYVANDETKGFGSETFGPLRGLATNVIHFGNFGVAMSFIWMIIIAVIMWVLLHRSVYGRYLYAVGRNEEAARYSGINTRLVIGGAYALSMLLTAISGILFAFFTNSISPSDHGAFYELYGIAAAVLGGCSLRGGEGSIIGIILGTILLQVLQNLVTLLGIPSSLNFAVMGAVIFIGVMVDQLLGSRKRRVKAPAAVQQQADAMPAKPAVGGPTS
jgi:ribose transport system permease protein